jgi:hypothetical protein
MSERVTVGDAGLDELAAAFPCWRIWRSRPHGLWWATRRGTVQYHDLPRRPGWGITIGGVRTLAELGCQLTVQRELDDPARLPVPAEPPPLRSV